MENNTLENKPKYDLSDDKKEFKNKIYAVIAFIVLFFIVSALSEYLFAFIISNARNIETDTLIKSLTKFDYDNPEYDEIIISSRYLVLALANLTGYLLSFIALCFFLRLFILSFSLSYFPFHSGSLSSPRLSEKS